MVENHFSSPRYDRFPSPDVTTERLVSFAEVAEIGWLLLQSTTTPQARGVCGAPSGQFLKKSKQSRSRPRQRNFR
jgi:hypothetical protein